MTRYGVPARRLAVECYFSAQGNAAAAARLLAQRWTRGMGPRPKAPDKFVRQNAAKFDRTGSVADVPSTGRPPKLSKAQAAKAAKLLGEGYTECVRPARGGPPVERRRRFSGIKQALALSAPLRRIKAKAGVTADTLWARALQANPRIRQRVGASQPASGSAEARRPRRRQADDE